MDLSLDLYLYLDMNDALPALASVAYPLCAKRGSMDLHDVSTPKMHTGIDGAIFGDSPEFNLMCDAIRHSGQANRSDESVCCRLSVSKPACIARYIFNMMR